MDLNSKLQSRCQQSFRQAGLPHKPDQELMNLPGNVFGGPDCVSDLARTGGKVLKLRHTILGAVQQAPLSRGDRGGGIIREGEEQVVPGMDRIAGVGEGNPPDHELPSLRCTVSHHGPERSALNKIRDQHSHGVQHGRHDVHRRTQTLVDSW